MATHHEMLRDWLNGTPTGGPNGDGRYPLIGQDGETYLVLCPAAQALDPTIDTAQLDVYLRAAAGSADRAQAWAENDKGIAVDPGKFSAKHWAGEAQDIVDSLNAATLSNDWDSITKSGFYYNSASSAVGTPRTWSSISLLHTEQGSNATQMAWRSGGDMVWTRRRASGVWTPWVEFWHSANFDPENYALAATSIGAGNGLTGGGNLTSGRTISLGTPSSVSSASSNSATSTSHSHAIDNISEYSGRTVFHPKEGRNGTNAPSIWMYPEDGGVGFANASTLKVRWDGEGVMTLGAVPWARLSGHPSVTAGNGLSGGGSLSATRTIALGTPGTLSGSTTNAVTSGSHTHALSANLSAWDAISPSAPEFNLSQWFWTVSSTYSSGAAAILFRNGGNLRYFGMGGDGKLRTSTSTTFSSGPMVLTTDDFDPSSFNPSDFALATRSITAGNGLSGGGNLTANRTITLGTPSTITLDSGNSVTSGSHTHSLDLRHTMTAASDSAPSGVTVSDTYNLTGLTGSVALTGWFNNSRAVQFLATNSGGTATPRAWFRTHHPSGGGGGWTEEQELWHSGNLNPGDYALGSRSISAGNGLSGGGNLTANRTISLGTPGTLSGSTTNSVSASSHTHALSANLSAWDGLHPDDAIVFRELIPGSANLDNYDSTGWYHQNTNANASSGTNYPVASAGLLSVYSVGTFVYQTYINYANGDTYTRARYNGTWRGWMRDWDNGNFDPGTKANTSTSISAGNGLSGGGTLASNRTISLGTPGTITATSTNSVSGTSHTHNLDTTGNFTWTGNHIFIGDMIARSSSASRQLTIERTGNSINAAAAYTTTGNTIYAGQGDSGYFNWGTNTDLRWSHADTWGRIGPGGLEVKGSVGINGMDVSANGSGKIMHVQTTHGYFRAGPNNTTWCHFYTDRPSFYFSTGIAVAGDISFYNGASMSNSGGNVVVSGELHDSSGNVRKLSGRVRNASTTLGSVDLNSVIEKSNNSSYTYTIPVGLGSVRDAITIVNSGTGGNITVARATDVSLYRNGTNANIVVGPGSMLTIYRSNTTNRWIA